MITLFPDEKIVSSSDGNAVILTTHRICYEHKEWGRSYNQSIMLEHITSCENSSESKNWLLLLSGLVLCIGLVQSHLLGVCGFISVVFVLLFINTRHSVISVGSPSTKMDINITGMKREKVLSFINLIEQTKHKRDQELHKRG